MSRNRAYPIKGVDNVFPDPYPSLVVGRNGIYPIKGITTRKIIFSELIATIMKKRKIPD